MSAFSQSLFNQELKYASEEDFRLTFSSILTSFLSFHTWMLIALLLELLIFSILLNISTRSLLLATNLAFILATLFSYLILNYYLQIRKNEQLIKLKNNYIFSLREEMNGGEDHLAIAKVLRKLAELLHQQDFTKLSILPEKIKRFLIEKDTQAMIEMLFLSAIEELHMLIKKIPSDIKGHTSLSNILIDFSKIYLKRPHSISSSRYQFTSDKMKQKYETALLLAIEELKILDEYVPNDPWIHARLATCYHDLNLIEKEIEEYELLKNLCPDDPDVLYKLGKLYFQKGLNAKAMRIYEKLKVKNDKLAKKLIATYDISIKVLFAIKY